MKNTGGPHQMRPTQPDTRDSQPVDNFVWGFWVSDLGTVHLARAGCARRFVGQTGTRVHGTIPDGARCALCLPKPAPPGARGRRRTGWPPR